MLIYIINTGYVNTVDAISDHKKRKANLSLEIHNMVLKRLKPFSVTEKVHPFWYKDFNEASLTGDHY